MYVKMRVTLIKHGFDGYKVGTFGENLKLFWPKP
jgi:hypothetical protein